MCECENIHYVTKLVENAKRTLKGGIRRNPTGNVIKIIGKGFHTIEEAEKWIFDTMVADSSKMSNFFIRYDKKHGDYILSDESKHTITSFKIT